MKRQTQTKSPINKLAITNRPPAHRLANRYTEKKSPNKIAFKLKQFRLPEKSPTKKQIRQPITISQTEQPANLDKVSDKVLDKASERQLLLSLPHLSSKRIKKKLKPKTAIKKDKLEINGYLFLEKLDSGGFGTVYKAVKDSETVAVKVIKLDPNEKNLDSDLKRELAVLMQVEHEHIVHCYDIMRTTHRVYIFMEYASGGTLGKYVRKYGPLPVRILVSVLQNKRRIDFNLFLISSNFIFT